MCARTRGFTLIEMVVAIVIISVGLAGVVMAFNTAVKSSTDPLIRKQMLAIGEEMMEEILLKPYAVAANTAATGCARDTFNDVYDYNNYSSTTVSGGVTTAGICDIDGNRILALAAYTVQVQVAGVALSTVPNTKAYQITVTVSHNGADTLVLTGWRTAYA